MQGNIDKIGICKLSWDLREERLYSPDGAQQCLPCESCGHPEWVHPRACSVLCDVCVKAREEGEQCIA